MNDALRERCEAARALLAERGEDETRTRYRVGAIIAELKTDATKYGRAAVDLLARSLHWDAATAYRHAAVAERWTVEAFEEIASRVDVFGRRPSFSHLIILAGVASARRRAALLDRLLADGLSVRALAALAREPFEDNRGRAPVLAHQIARQMRECVRWKRRLARWSEELLASAEELVACGDGEDVRALLARAEAQHLEIERLWMASLQRLKQARAEAERRAASTPPPRPRRYTGPRLLAGMHPS